MSTLDPSLNSAAAPEPSTLIECLRQKLIYQGEDLSYTFLVDGDREEIHLTYRELDQRCSAIGAALQLAGAAGEPVLLLYPPGLEFIAAFLGCLYAGAIAVPVYPPKLNRSQARLQKVIADSQARVALTTRGVLAGVERCFGEEPYMKALRWLATDEITNDHAKLWREPAVNGETLAMLQYTSGSTSTPKGVMVTHQNLLSNQRMIEKTFGLNHDSIFVSWLPLYHDMGLIGSVLQSLYLGIRCILMAPTAFLQKPFRWLRAISDYQATISGGPNFAYDLCVRKIGEEDRARLNLSSWTQAFNGSEPICHETLERFTAAFASSGLRPQALYPCYGMAETTLLVSGGRPDQLPIIRTFQSAALENHRAIPAEAGQPGSRSLVGCGNNLSDQRIAIVRPESLTECPEGEIGEIWVSGPSVAQGYWRREQATAETFRARLPDGEGPFLRSGDLGFILEGELFITGRLKDLIIIDGRNHYPQDLELTVEKSHPAIRPGCCAAFSIDAGGREDLVVVAELDRRHRHPNQEELLKTVRQAVGEEHELRVAHLWLIDYGSIPKTSSGKIQRYACRVNFLEHLAGHSDLSRSGTP